LPLWLEQVRDVGVAVQRDPQIRRGLHLG
jgi:hypothetical protein